MILRYIILYVPEVATAMDFYARAFGVERQFLHESGSYGEMATGEARLAFSALSLMAELGKEVATEPPERPSFELAFETADVPAALARALGAGATLVQDTSEMPWGQTLAYVRAPEGTLVEICTAVA